MIVVIGGGPAGFFGAIAARETNPDLQVVLLEKQGHMLRKVAISGGGRCNATHACPDPRQLAAHYPRGGRALIGPFTRWGVQQTIDWFAERGVELKTEPDGRMFPVTDSSQTIVDCLLSSARRAGVEVRPRQPVAAMERHKEGGLRVRLRDGSTLEAEGVLLATGGSARVTGSGGKTDGHALARSLGHSIEPLVPSLFTFHLRDKAWTELAGLVAEPVSIRALGSGLPPKALGTNGPLLFTHWGLSGPAVLKLSAWGARLLHDVDYRFEAAIDWLPDLKVDEVDAGLLHCGEANPRKSVAAARPYAHSLPRRLWERLINKAQIAPDGRWAELGRKPRRRLAELLKDTRLAVEGKSTYKEEFVTCGGVPLPEVDMKTMQSKVCPGLHLAGEVLDIDGVTGGFNFQAAWTTGRLAGVALAEAAKRR